MNQNLTKNSNGKDTPQPLNVPSPSHVGEPSKLSNSFSELEIKRIQRGYRQTEFYKRYVKRVTKIIQNEKDWCPLELRCIMKDGARRDFYPPAELLEKFLGKSL